MKMETTIPFNLSLPEKASMLNYHSVNCFVILFIVIGILVPMEAGAQSANLLLVNDQVTPVPSTVVSLPANNVYDALGIPIGTPVRVRTENGDLLSTSLTSEEDVLNIWTTMKPLECQRVVITPDSKWRGDDKLIFAHCDSEKTTFFRFIWAVLQIKRNYPLMCRFLNTFPCISRSIRMPVM